ncbi:MAG TPA: LPXTG cell wall anchor domain-containing protein, partial [Candidatus Saccharimonadales bacterium]|nr:LPXTG cell wall anchor domain-containing protein [Candidatus Saccharimonadales bacterium]
QSAVKDVKVVDLLPKGFVYQGGSWTATSSERGDLKSEGTTTEPTYHSPGTWKLGDMIIGETVTLTLFANIDGGEKSGLYKDLATAQGTSLAASPVQANSDTGVFVGTAVNVVNGEVQGASIKVNQTQEVLGASTVAEGLPETGAKTFWMYIAGAFLIFGFGSVVIGYYLRRRYNA